MTMVLRKHGKRKNVQQYKHGKDKFYISKLGKSYCTHIVWTVQVSYVDDATKSCFSKTMFILSLETNDMFCFHT